MTKDRAEALVAEANEERHADGQHLPSELVERAERQNRHLVELAASLIHSGIEESKIVTVLRDAMSSYEEELLNTILTLREGRKNG